MRSAARRARGDTGAVGKHADHRWRFDLSIAIRRQPADVLAFLADIQDAEPIPRRAAVKMVKEPLLWLEKTIEPYLRRQLVRRLKDIQQLLEPETTSESRHRPARPRRSLGRPGKPGHGPKVSVHGRGV